MNTTFLLESSLSVGFVEQSPKGVLKPYAMGGPGLGWALLEQVIKKYHHPLIQGSGNMAEEGEGHKS